MHVYARYYPHLMDKESNNSLTYLKIMNRKTQQILKCPLTFKE